MFRVHIVVKDERSLVSEKQRRFAQPIVEQRSAFSPVFRHSD